MLCSFATDILRRSTSRGCKRLAAEMVKAAVECKTSYIIVIPYTVNKLQLIERELEVGCQAFLHSARL